MNLCPQETAAHPLAVHPRAPEQSQPIEDATAAAVPSGPTTLSPVWILVALVGISALAWGGWTLLGGAADAPTAAVMSPADRRQAEILELAIDNAPDPSLMRLYGEINSRHFGGRLPQIPVIWEPRLAEVGPLAARAFTLHGMFGHIGDKAAILLNPVLASDADGLRRALSHEMVHASLWVNGELFTGHGPAFQTALERLADEGAFSGIVATDRQQEDLRLWLQNEAARLDTEQDQVRRESETLAAEARALEQALADLKARGAASPEDPEVLAWVSRRDAHNRRVEELRLRTERGQADLASYNKEVERYNLMLSYPDGLDERPTLATRR